MTGDRNTVLWNRLGRLGLWAQAGLVTGIVVFIWVAVAPVAYRISGSVGLIAATVGAGLCLVGAQLALCITFLFRKTDAAVYAVVFGMLARTLVPLLLGTILHLQVPALADAGMIFYLLLFYFAVLATETMLLLAQIPRSPGSQRLA